MRRLDSIFAQPTPAGSPPAEIGSVASTVLPHTCAS